MAASETARGEQSGCPGVAATLLDRHLTVTSRTRLAEELFPRLRPGVNLAREAYLGRGCDVRPEQPQETRLQVAAALLAGVESPESHAELIGLIGELSTMSREFCSDWAGVEPSLQANGIVRVTHPHAGALSIRYDLRKSGSNPGSGDLLIVWQVADAQSTAVLDECLGRSRHQPNGAPRRIS
jgi:hypothetical protein